MAQGEVDAASVALALRACTRAGLWQAALEIFSEARHIPGLKLGSATYNAALYAVALGRSWSGALALLSEMGQRAVPMTRSTRNAALRACVGGGTLPQEAKLKDSLAAATTALALLRKHGLGASQQAAWEEEGLAPHAEITDSGLKFAASRVELRLLGARRGQKGAEAELVLGDVDGEQDTHEDECEDRGFLGSELAGAFVDEGDSLQENSTTLLPHVLDDILERLMSSGLSAYTQADAQATESCRQALQEEVSAAFGYGAAHVHLVGSRLYGAALPGADIDLLVELSGACKASMATAAERRLLPEDRSRLLAARAAVILRRHLEGHDSNFWASPEVVLDTRRPLLRLTCTVAGSEISVEVSFDPELAALRKSSALAIAFAEGAEGCRDLRPLALARLVRFWAASRGLAGQQDGYPSGFAWCLMAIFYSQCRLGLLGGLAPKSSKQLSAFFVQESSPRSGAVELSLEDLQKAVPLLPGFFNFYASTFSWQGEVISTRLGRRMHRRELLEQNHTGLLCIEDPLEPDSDLAATYLSRHRNLRLRAEMRRANRFLNWQSTAGDDTEVIISRWAETFRTRHKPARSERAC
eukprot:TRINITY_DN78070_c0_g1_i1.p1 TRINITY_DN78070_c0_g1~~TRINITY_DN78070_c0_g1_i1.p1  ORF type:complete len:662 (+),score=139.75 TRINITY_DN78070_c0_g1_i1:230-1987(+)